MPTPTPRTSWARRIRLAPNWACLLANWPTRAPGSPVTLRLNGPNCRPNGPNWTVAAAPVDPSPPARPTCRRAPRPPLSLPVTSMSGDSRGAGVGPGIGAGARVGVGVDTDPHTDPPTPLTAQVSPPNRPHGSAATDLSGLPQGSIYG
jgi:hypothetical protein